MTISRRNLLLTMGAAALLPGRVRAATREALFVACAARLDGSYSVDGFDAAGKQRFEIPLPARGHGMAFHPARPEAVVFARRPGMFVGVIDLTTGRAARWVEAPNDRCYYGHGTYSPDGRLMFATENDFEAGRGVLGVYDTADGYRRIGEFASHGVGPHQVRLMPDGKSLAVANGGILTHPLRGRDKLNLDTMAPNLSILDLAKGTVRREYTLPQELHQLSIRHIDIDSRERVAVSMQYEGDLNDDVALVALADPAHGMRLLRAPADVELRLRQYTGAVAFDASGGYIGASGPRGGIAVVWDALTGRYLRHFDAPDTSGIAPSGKPGEFILSGGDGAIRRADVVTGHVALLAPPNHAHRWDNHVEPADAAT